MAHLLLVSYSMPSQHFHINLLQRPTRIGQCRTSQVLSWLVIPLMQGYADAGDFTFWTR